MAWRIPVGGHSRDHRRLMNNRIRSMDVLEAVNRDCVSSRTYLQGKEFATQSQDLEGTAV